MKVLYVGPFEHSWGTEEHVARAFEALGHEVSRSPIRYWDGKSFSPEVAEILDLFVTQSPLPNMPTETLRWLEANGCATASIHLDLYYGLRRRSQIGADGFWRTGAVFTADGDPRAADYFASLDINHKWFPPAVAHDETHEGIWRDEYDHDIVFVGSTNYHPEWPWRGQLLRELQARYGDRFKIYDHHPPTRGNDLNDLYATARIIVGDSLALPGHQNYFSDRIFETIGRGGALVFPRVPGLEDPLGFREYEHLRFYEVGDIEGLFSTIDEMLAEPEEQRLMAKRGQQFVIDRHTYVHRVQEMLAVLGLADAA